MNRLVLSLLLCVAVVARAEDFAARRSEVLALGKLVAPPAFVDAEEFRSRDGIRAIYFDGKDT